MPISATSWMLSKLNEERNTCVRRESDVERYWVQFAYIAVIPFSIIEVIFTQALRCATYFAENATHEHRYFSELAKSSLWGLIWTIDCIFMNLCAKQLFTSERAYIHFISHFSCQTFRKRFNQEDICQVLKQLDPPSVPDSVKKLLENYEAGENALKHSAIYEMLYEMLPDVEPARIQNLPGDIGNWMEGWDNKDQIVKILRGITEQNPLHWTELNRRFIKMLVFTIDTINKSSNPDDLVNFKIQFSGVFHGCVNRMTVEMEAIFFQFAAPSLFGKTRNELVERTQQRGFADADEKFFDLIYLMIPKPTKEECNAIIAFILGEIEDRSTANQLINFLMGLTSVAYERLAENQQRFLKMLLFTHKSVTDPKRAEKEPEAHVGRQKAFITSLLTMRGDVETDKESNETLFFTYGGAKYLFKQADRELLLYDYTQHRKDSSTHVMQIILEHHDVATHINFYADDLYKVFGLSRPPLSAVDHAHHNMVDPNCRAAIITAFRKYYLSPHTIYAFFYEIFTPKEQGHKDFRQFNRTLYEDGWVKKKYFAKAQREGTLTEGETLENFVPEDSLGEDGLPHPSDVIEFLVEMKLLKPKIQGNEWPLQ